jgi:Mitochondrial carrier protein
MTQGTLYDGSVRACVRAVVRHDGIGGLYTGIVPRVAYIVPSVAIFFIAYEFTQQKLRYW